ncbi:MAG: outer membrane lipoprotein carrier protein LolA [Flavobacteriales bacterium]|nr:outer membrane lipoprotein carrier protein LolA [Flavobacteriales bacterium]
MILIKEFRAVSLAIVGVMLAMISFAQDEKASAILSDLSSKMQKFESVSANFSSKMIDKQADMEVDQQGSIKVSGDSYYLTIADITVISDGQNVWTYSKKSNEVMIDLAEDLYDEEGIEPAELFTIWETGFKSQHAGNETVAGVECDVIKLFPNNPEDKAFHTIKIYIDTEALEMKRAIIMGKEGNNTVYNITSFNTDYIQSTQFKFDKSKYPGVEVIDNR